MVVDDNPINLKVFISLLKRTKLNVDVAESGKECLELIAKKQYDLIFLDHMMPEMDGIETLHHMKEMPDNQSAEVPVIALTANAITGAKEMYLAEGFNAFLPKPINPEKLEQLILKLLPRDLLQFDIEDEQTDITETVVEKSYTVEAELPAVDGIDWSYGLMHLNNQELLMSTVGDFYKTLEMEADKLDDFYQRIESDPAMVQQYRIKVHSMKSSANLIGATVLGGMAKMLEDAARKEDIEFIICLHGYFIKDWRSYKEKLKECMQVIGKNQPKEEKKETADRTVILAYLDQLQEAMEEMDIDSMDENMAKLEEYQYSEEVQENIEKLSVLVTNMDSDEAVKLIEKIKNEIKK